MVLALLYFFRSEWFLQDSEYDSWSAVADYVFQVIPFSVLLLEHSILSVEEFECYVCIDASSGSGRDSYGRPYGHSRLQILIVKQGGLQDVSSLLVENRPQIVVDEGGG